MLSIEFEDEIFIDALEFLGGDFVCVELDVCELLLDFMTYLVGFSIRPWENSSLPLCLCHVHVIRDIKPKIFLFFGDS